MEFRGGKAGVVEHAFQFGTGVGIAARGVNEHVEGKEGSEGRRGAVVIRDEFESGGAAAGGERGANFAKKGFASGGIEVVEEIGQQHRVVGPTEFHLKRTARQHVVHL